MGDSHSNREIGEANKLAGLANYYVWSLKIRALLRAEGLWELTKTQFLPASFPADYSGENVTTTKLKKVKALVVKILTMSVKDELIDTVAEHAEPLAAWAALKKAYQARSQSQILTLTGQLQTMKLAEGASTEESIEEYG
jgi:hypothetical protein